MASMMLFTDCSSSSAAAARLLPFCRHQIPDGGLVQLHRSARLQFGLSNPSSSRTFVTYTFPSPPLVKERKEGLGGGGCGVWEGGREKSISLLFIISSSKWGILKWCLITFTAYIITAAAGVSVEAAAKVIDGKKVAKEIRDEIATEISKMKDAIGVVPGLAVILVGDRKDSATYVHNKKKACESVGITSYEVRLSEDSTEQEVIKHITCFNNDPSVHGILVQLPLPSHMNEQNVLDAVCIEKDVDGFNPLNSGRLAMRGIEPLFVPCTPKGCIELLRRYGIEIKGKRAVVLGRSNIVGRPAASLLDGEDATVTVVHSRTQNPEEITREADILIAAVGRPNMVRGSWIKPGAVIIDVGINAVEDAKSPRGYRLVGDVCYEEASKIASAITPVPGGVGPMTIAMLLSNTLVSAKRAHHFV
ncbi:hypothetical protein RJ639_012895 [Escallonia herrerae]|uniref:Methenyltetrahydrofolate cyclohydrolase n=1 Tax=Escallonia herrerae TaxID=1293975 RepID=A0AA89AQG8_9ASTE|nr:hypothetical protein RJ639_012895 [Escallonia herrerae]